MKRCNREKTKHMRSAAVFLLAACVLTGCGKGNDETILQEEFAEDAKTMQTMENVADNGETVQMTDGGTALQETGIIGEGGADEQIDFAALQEENPEIFAWICIPETDIDCPVLQSMHGDDFYEKHDAYGQESENGAVYIELANLASMCDFNTVMHGKTGKDGNGPFAGLYQFADPEYFEKHENLYLYLDGNVLTYEIFAAYERENTSLLRSYDFTYQEGCEQFLNDLYSIRDMKMNLREGWEGVTPYHFLITLTTQREDNPDKQFVVLAILTQDAAGTIDRIVAE